MSRNGRRNADESLLMALACGATVDNANAWGTVPLPRFCLVRVAVRDDSEIFQRHRNRAIPAIRCAG
jgi:hypothetical protein